MRATLSALAAFFVLAGTASAASPDIVISQVYGGGGNAGATLKNDFIELYNRGTAPVSVAGWTVQYASARPARPGSARADGDDPPRPLLPRAGGGRHRRHRRPADTERHGQHRDGGGSGKVALVTNGDALACGADCDTAPGVKDFVGYGAANDFETAPTPLLANTTAALRNGGGNARDR